MLKRNLTLAAAAFAIVGASGVAVAQQGPGPQRGMMMDEMQRGGPGPMMRQGGSGPMHDRYGDGRGMMMGPGMMGPHMMTMMMAMMDTDSDGALSLEEVQAVHARMFNYADDDGDGKLTPAEMMDFMHGGAFDDEQ